MCIGNEWVKADVFNNLFSEQRTSLCNNIIVKLIIFLNTSKANSLFQNSFNPGSYIFA